MTLEPRIGIGYDVHPLVEGRPLVLGGVTLDHPRGLAGHSDADALSHAVVDALLGAAHLGDIGSHFPPSDPAFAGISSLRLLEEAARRVNQAGYRILNVDSVIVAEEPRMAPHLARMATCLAEAMSIEPGRVGVKATSPEGLGALGRAEGIAAQAVALVAPAPAPAGGPT